MELSLDMSIVGRQLPIPLDKVFLIDEEGKYLMDDENKYLIVIGE